MMTKRKDDQATMDQQFLDPESYVTPDGRHVLKGEDWLAQKRLVWERGQHRCENIIRHDSIGRCTNEMNHVHHKIFRSDSRDDRIENLIGLCIECHRAMHPEKELQWSKR